MKKDDELFNIITKFAESGWDLIDLPAKAWLDTANHDEAAENITEELIQAVTKADLECGSCGCEFDPLYKRALVLLQAN